MRLKIFLDLGKSVVAAMSEVDGQGVNASIGGQGIDFAKALVERFPNVKAKSKRKLILDRAWEVG